MSIKTLPNVWAVIVGIDHYPSDRCLGGAVQDARAMRDYLREQSPQAKIYTFTATCPSDANSSYPIEPEELWPTWDNVISFLRKIIKEAKHGDLVYFHYSGHGTKIPRSTTSGLGGEDELAFVLFGNNEYGSQYLEGRHLATALCRMVDMGLVVTLVLDCCFSGSVARHGETPGLGIRCSTYNQDIEIASIGEFNESLFKATSRDSRVEKDWLVNPNGYTILTACGPFETASEVQIGSIGRRGALSYYLLAALRQLSLCGIDPSHQDLHQRLATTFHAVWPQQTPMRYGNRNLSFLGQMIVSYGNGFISIVKLANGTLRLRAGEAHGICEGHEFAAYPYEEAVSNAVLPGAKLKVSRVRPLESDIVEISTKAIGSQIQTGWKARLSSCLSLQKVGVRLAANINNQNDWRKQAAKIDLISLFAEEDQEVCLFTVSVNDREEYSINAAYDKHIELPTIPVGLNEAIIVVLQILGHLGTFKFFEGVENRAPSTAFRKGFSINLHSDPSASGVFEVHHEGTWGFTVANTYDIPLYLSVFNFRPSWELDNMLSSSGGDSYLVVPPKQDKKIGEKQFRLIMEIPQYLQNQGQKQCEDIIKIFVTSKPTSFPSMVLPPLYWDHPQRSGKKFDADKLKAFLGDIAAQARCQDDIGGDYWATQNFIIKTTMNDTGGLD